MEHRTVTIPARAEHEGFHSLTITLAWVCPVCGGPRGEPFKGLSFSGSRRLEVDCWNNPCGHVDKYSAVREEPPYVPVYFFEVACHNATVRPSSRGLHASSAIGLLSLIVQYRADVQRQHPGYRPAYRVRVGNAGTNYRHVQADTPDDSDAWDQLAADAFAEAERLAREEAARAEFIVQRIDAPGEGRYVESIDTQDGDTQYTENPRLARIFDGADWREIWSDAARFRCLPYPACLADSPQVAPAR
jgi:hypothetical protein